MKAIRRDSERIIIDDTYSCRYLVGAGGTMCPVRREMFPEGRMKSRQIVTLEKEFEYPARGDQCHLYFFRRGLAGYAWIVPKGNGFVNIGLGGKAVLPANPAPRFTTTSAPSLPTWCATRTRRGDGRNSGDRPSYFLFTRDGG